MIGDTITLANQPSNTYFPELPGQVSDLVNVTKVSDEAYGSEYRYRFNLGQYTVKVRNTVEKGTVTKPQYNRHNVELTYERFADESDGTPGATFQAYAVFRLPSSEAGDEVKSLIYALGQFLNNGASKTYKMLNFES